MGLEQLEQAIARLTMELVGIDGDALLSVYEQLWHEQQHPPASLTG